MNIKEERKAIENFLDWLPSQDIELAQYDSNSDLKPAIEPKQESIEHLLDGYFGKTKAEIDNNTTSTDVKNIMTFIDKMVTEIDAQAYKLNWYYYEVQELVHNIQYWTNKALEEAQQNKETQF